MHKNVPPKKKTAEEIASEQAQLVADRARRNELKKNRRASLKKLADAQAASEKYRKARREEETRARVIRQAQEYKAREISRFALNLKRLEEEAKRRTIPEVKTL